MKYLMMVICCMVLIGGVAVADHCGQRIDGKPIPKCYGKHWLENFVYDKNCD